jgi:hypothetical protein
VQSVPETQMAQPVPSVVQVRTVLPWHSVEFAEVQPVPATTPTGRQRQAPVLVPPWQVRVPVHAVVAEERWQPAPSLEHVATVSESTQ